MSHAYPAVAREGRPDTIIHIGHDRVPLGGDHVTLIAGPCAVEGHDQLLETARGLRELGVQLLRGGAFKPRTSPHSFQGLGEDGLRMLAAARDATGMAIVTEVVAPEDVELVASYADVLQVGTRNMANYRLLTALGSAGKPVLLKRGQAATVEELLCAAEYIVAAGNPDVVLCERGTRTFDPLTRNAFDLNAIPLLRSMTHLPVIADPSHATGRADLVHAVSLGAVAAGSNGLIVEVHATPAAALIDGDQSIDLPAAARLIDAVGQIAAVTGRTLTCAERLATA